MSFRIQTVDAVSFNVDAETYERMVASIKRELKPILVDTINIMLTDEIGNNLIDKIVQDFDSDFYHNIQNLVSRNINYNYIVENIKNQVVNILLDNERFNTLLNRSINNATVGVVDETVERVTARLENQINKEGDI